MVEFLRLIWCNAGMRSLTAAGHELHARHARDAFAKGLIVHAPHRACAWSLTPAGRAMLEVPT